MTIRVLVTEATRNLTDVKELIDTVQANILTANPTAAEGDLPDLDEELAHVAEIAIIDGQKILDSDPDEQHVLATALEGQTPIIVKNAKRDALMAIVGIGTEAEQALIRSDSQTGASSLTVMNKLRLPVAPADAQVSEVQMGAEQISNTMADLDGLAQAKTQEEFTNLVAGLQANADKSTDQQFVPDMTDTDEDADEDGIPLAFLKSRPDLPKNAYRAYFVEHRATKGLLGQQMMLNPGSSINLGFLVEVYATDYPRQKYVVISSAGTGFSMGNMTANQSQDRGFYLENAHVSVGPKHNYGFLEAMSPESENRSVERSASTGFSTRVSADLGFAGWLLSGGIGVSSEWSSEESVAITLKNFETYSWVYNRSAKWSYKLSTLADGSDYWGWQALLDGENVSGTRDAVALKTLPIIAQTNLPVRVQAVYRFPPDQTGNVVFRFFASAQIRRVTNNNLRDKLGPLPPLPGTEIIRNMAADQGWVAWLGPREFAFDIGLVNHERDKPLVPKPEFLSTLSNKDGSEDLAFYRPSENEVFLLKNSGPDAYEVIKATVDWEALSVKVKKADPPPPRWLTTHTVKPGESLSMIAYKYYGSGRREFWQRIFDSNLDLLKKPSLINPGQQLRIPFETGPLPAYMNE